MPTPAGGLDSCRRAAAGWLHVDAATLDRLAFLHDLSGEYGGPGYVAAFALLAARLGRRAEHGVPVRALVALGQRSLSGYLTQSVVWTVLLMPWTLHLGAHGSTVTIALVVAVLTWAGTAAAAYALDRRGRQGPAETVLRTLVYVRCASTRPFCTGGSTSGATSTRPFCTGGSTCACGPGHACRRDRRSVSRMLDTRLTSRD